MVQYVYTLSSVGSMPEYLSLSLRSLLQYIDPEDVTVFFTPPRDEEHVEAIDAFGVDLRLVENRTESFSARNQHQPQQYGAKTWLGTAKADTVVFLDCDTIVLSDPTPLTKGGFEIGVRPDIPTMDQPGWRDLFHRFNRSDAYLDWMPNCGVIVFKNGTHREIVDQWFDLVNTDLGYQLGDNNHKEQYALALTIGDREIRKLTSQEHVMVWNNEYPTNGIIYHSGAAFEWKETAPTDMRGVVRLGAHHLKNQNF